VRIAALSRRSARQARAQCDDEQPEDCRAHRTARA
jgi:hypothetical protein